MIETDTTGEHGDATPLANALADRFRKAGFPAEAVQVIGPETRHRNLVVRLRGSPGGHSSLPHPGTAIPVLARGVARLDDQQPAARLDDTRMSAFE